MSSENNFKEPISFPGDKSSSKVVVVGQEDGFVRNKGGSAGRIILVRPVRLRTAHTRRAIPLNVRKRLLFLVEA